MFYGALLRILNKIQGLFNFYICIYMAESREELVSLVRRLTNIDLNTDKVARLDSPNSEALRQSFGVTSMKCLERMYNDIIKMGFKLENTCIGTEN